MVKQYGLNISDINIDERFFELCSSISVERQARVERYRKPKDKIRCLYAELLLKHALMDQGLALYDIEFEYGASGKPTLKKTPGVEFNLSHSGDWIVCATSSKPVGIDVEQIKERDFELLARHCLTEPEQLQLASLNPEARKDYFFKRWTIKESYVKKLGVGIGKDFKTFEAKVVDDTYRVIEDDIILAHEQFRVYKLDDYHQVAVCADEPIEDNICLDFLTIS